MYLHNSFILNLASSILFSFVLQASLNTALFEDPEILAYTVLNINLKIVQVECFAMIQLSTRNRIMQMSENCPLLQDLNTMLANYSEDLHSTSFEKRHRISSNQAGFE